MNSFIKFLFIFQIIVFSSCNNEIKLKDKSKIKTVSELKKPITNKEKIIKSKDLKRYFPDKFESTLNDTLLQSGISIEIVKNTIMNSSVLLKYEEDDSFTYDYYRDYEVIIKIKGLNSKLIEKRFLKETFEVDVKEFNSQATITNLWFHSIDNSTNILKFQCSICAPETDYCYFYSIYIDNKGKVKIELEEIT